MQLELFPEFLCPVREVTKAVCVDFDKTICFSSYPDVGPMIPGAKSALEAIKSMGYYIIIYSCRTCRHLQDIFGATQSKGVRLMKLWLDANQIPYDEIDDGTKGKPMVDYYIDDKGIRFENNWPEIVQFIESKEKEK